MGLRMGIARLFVVAAAVLVPFSAGAQTTPYQEYDRLVKANEMVSPLGSELFGDNVGLYNGSTEFTVSDIDIPGNNSLPVRLGRSFKVELRNDADSLGGFGAWDIEVPYITGVFPAGGKWNISGMVSLPRCSAPFFPDVNAPFYLNEVWTGTQVHVPGRGNQTMMWNGNTGNPQPTDGQSYYWNTRDQMRFRCTSMLNYAGEGFIGVDSAGVKYFFNYAIEKAGGVVRKSASGWGEVAANRFKIYLVATRVEDRFGNYVNYTYDGDRLIKISSSDQRVIDLTYTDGRITKATAHGREWQYAYSPSQYFSIHQRAKALTSVTLPDQSRWQYQYQGTLQLDPVIQDGATGDMRCIEPLPNYGGFGLVATHPSGAVGNFAFAYQRHGISGTPANACVLEAVIGGVQHWSLVIPDYFYNFALATKQISGPGLQTMQWEYAYGEPLTGRANYGGLYCTTCDDEKSVWVTNPDGTKDEYVFGVLFNFNDGRMLGKYRRQADNKIVRAELTEYVTTAEAASMPFPGEIGYLHGAFDYTTGYNRPVKKTTILQDGDIAGPVEFVPPPPPDPWIPPGGGGCVPEPPSYTCEQPTALPGGPVMMVSEASAGASMSTTSSGTPPSAFIRQVNTFDALARPVDETRQGPVHSRRTVTAYHDNTSKWVLGQTASVTCMASVPASGICDGNDVMSSTTFDTPTALPVAHYSFGKLSQTLSYHADGTVAVFRDGNNSATTLSNWKRGIPQTIQHPATPEAPAGAIESAVVNDSGWITSVTNEVGSKTCYGHDGMGRLARVTHPSESVVGVCDASAWNVETLTFVPVQHAEHGLAPGHWTMMRRLADRHVNTYYDALWRPVLEESLDHADVNGTLSQVVKRYDHDGKMIFQSYPKRGVDRMTESQGVHTIYDTLGRVTSVSQDSEHGLLTTTSEYLAGFQTRTTNPRGFQTLTEYQAFDQPTHELVTGITQFANADTAATEIHRDIFGKPTRIRKRNASGSLFVDRHYVYDSAQQLCKAVEPETGATVMDYDGAGNLQWSASGLHHLIGTTSCDTIAGRDSGRKVTRYYDARNRLSSLLFPNGVGNQTWHYWSDGLVRSIVTDNDGPGTGVVTNHYDYNKRRLLTGESSGQAGWYTWGLGYAYDANGSLAIQTYPTGLAISYAPNALGQATQARDQSGSYYASGASYYPNGAIKQFTYGNGVVHSMAQNARQLPQRVLSSGVSDLRYDYDQNGNVSVIGDETSGRNTGVYSRWMTYDGLDRLTSAGSCMFGGDCWHRFTYDALDNMRSWKLPGVKDYAEYVYNTQNQLANIKNSGGASVVALEYGLQGNLENKNGQVYGFDYGNRLRTVVDKENYRYDGHGRRVLAWEVASTQSILSMYASSGQVMYEENYRPSVQKAFEHIYFAGSVVASRERHIVTNVYDAKFHHTDALASPVAVTSQTGAVLERNDYEPYGAIIGKPTYQGIGYTGHVQDGATGLTYMQQRYYDPQVGLFLSVDPVTAYGSPIKQFNRYRYADSNPYKFTDPDGRQAYFMTPPGFESVEQVKILGSTLPGVGDVQGFVEAYKDPTPTNVLAAVVGLGGPAGDAAAAGLKTANVASDVGKSVAAANRAENLAKGIPASQLGPSGKPKIHSVQTSSIKRSEDGARSEVGKGGTTVRHQSPARGGPHHHGVSAKGEKSRIHYEYPKSRK